LSFTPVKNPVLKLNPTKTGVDFQQVIRPHPRAGHHVVIINSVELNILIGGRKMKSAAQSKDRFEMRYYGRIALGCAFLCFTAGAVWPEEFGGCARDVLTGEWISTRTYGTVVLWSIGLALAVISAFSVKRAR
jgi:hypothetical protein